MLSEGTVLQSRYRIVRQLGQGGMGAVYEAVDERLDTIVALKETLFTDEKLRKQFEREARLLARLHHPALPRVSDHFNESEGQFLVMQFIAGDDLAEMLTQRNAPFPQDEVLRWADQLCDALDYLHTQEPQIIHRDIKPEPEADGARANRAVGFRARQRIGWSVNGGNDISQHLRLHTELRAARAGPGHGDRRAQ